MGRPAKIVTNEEAADKAVAAFTKQVKKDMKAKIAELAAEHKESGDKAAASVAKAVGSALLTVLAGTE